MSTKEIKTIRLRFKHGLGDAVQFGIVLRHLRQQYPQAHIYLETKPGREALFRHLVDELHDIKYPWDQWSGDINKYVQFNHCEDTYGTVPTTKVTQCLTKEFDIGPDPRLYQYSVSISDEAKAAAAKWRADLGPANVVLIHYEGVSCPQKKNIPRPLVAELCGRLVAAGVTPVLLDWGLNKVADNRTIFTPTLPQDSDHVAAMIEAADLFVGIDSGPAHIAGALDTFSICLWSGFFPGHNFDPCSNVFHYLTEEAASLAYDAYDVAYFNDHYKYDVWPDLEGMMWELGSVLCELLGAESTRKENLLANENSPGC